MLTVSVNDLHNEKYSVENNCFVFEGEGSETLSRYSCQIDFYKEIIPQVRIS